MFAKAIGNRLIHSPRMQEQRGRVCREGKRKGVSVWQAAGSQRLVLRLLKPENLMNESTSRDLEGMHVFAVQEPEIEGRQSGQGYQDNPEH